MAEKKHPGSGLVFQASSWNQMADAANYFAQRQQLGEPNRKNRLQWDRTVIRIKNESGESRRRGEILKIGDPLHDALSNNTIPDLHPGNYGYSGSQVTSVSDKFCVLLDWASDGQTVEAQVCGITGALVDITDTDHEYCTLKEDAYTFQSAETGAHRIISKSSGTGEKTCVVLLYTTAPSTNCDIIRFQVVSADPITRTCLGEIEARPNGCGIDDVPDTTVGGTVIEICDPAGCYFAAPSDELIGRMGWAKYMQPVTESVCQPNPTEGPQPQWEVFALCCAIPACIEG